MAKALTDGDLDELTLEERVERLRRQGRLAVVVSAATLALAAGGTAALFAYVDKAIAHPGGAAELGPAGEGDGAHAHGEKAPAEGGREGSAADDEAARVGEIHAFEPFVVNLLDAANVRYVKVRVAVEAPDPVVAEEVRQRDAQLKDSVISVLSNRTYADLQGVYGKNQVREELLVRFNRLLSSGRLTRLYFTEFVVQ